MRHLNDTIKLNCHAELVSAFYSSGVEPQVGKTLNLSWIIRVLTGVTSRSNLRARLRRRPTENPQIQGDTKLKAVEQDSPAYDIILIVLGFTQPTN